MKMNIGWVGCLLFMLISKVHAQPMIRLIQNNTPFQFTVIKHNDISDCSPLNSSKSVIIEPYETFQTPLLLGSDKPGLLLRPSAFYDRVTQKNYPFLDKHGHVDMKKLEKAFEAWKASQKKTYKKSAEVWLAQWVCGDISLIHNHVEVFGYLLNISIARIDNEHHHHACMVDYSEGLFSRQVIEIKIDQKSKKGIIPHVKSFVGQGGLCQDGKVISI